MPNIPTKPKYETRQVAINIIEDYYNPTVMLPALYFHINPQEFKMDYRKIIHRYKTFTAHVEEYWGDELDTISCDGSTGGFLTEDFGLDAINRKTSKPFFKFQDILDVYRNNGNIYNSSGQVIRKGSVVIFFDPGTYYGYFENFSYIETADNPFRFIFNFTFKVQRSYNGV